MAAAVSAAAHGDHASARSAARGGFARERSIVSAAAPACDLALISDRSGFDALEAQWNALFERSGRDTQLFQSFNWLWHWCNHYLADGNSSSRLAIVTGRRGGRLVMVWPLVIEKLGFLRTLTWMGLPVSQYGDVLVDDAEDSAALLRQGWEFITRKIDADVIQLRKVRADASVAQLLEAVGAICTDKLAAPYLDLASAPSFDEYEKRYSSGARRNRKRQRRRLEERGAVSVETHTQGDGAAGLVHAAIELKQRWLEDKGLLSTALADDRFESFFADVARGAERPAGCRVLVMKCGGVPAAIEIGLDCKGRSAIHVIVYDSAFEKAAAGALLMEDGIRRACDAGLTTFDLLAPAAPYKSDWADGAMEVGDWLVPLSLTGQVYGRLYLGFFRNVLRSALGLMPTGLRRVVAVRLGATLKARKAA